ncbi:extracellular catalytic domain type 1 short-chain-length polyhydroxyalkanoate depolymerase [Pseudonocardia xinjiangensis]|uniref:extracellular catalytic domain type 1 short-chain-length polyhydroxyalkanoate depolymerase n=1 Tax=Pseudonocardia xinjiangensis TaxID=75289 RepID=UPI003D8BFFAD
MRRTGLLIAIVVTITAILGGLGVVGAPPAQAATLTQVSNFGSNPGALAMYAYRPAGATSGRPVVVALHGCTQNAAGYAAGSGWTELADRWGFTVVFPQQPTANNQTSCFNWFQAGDVTRGQGEAASIAAMVAYTRSTWGAGRAYVSGLSAGGAMSAAMLAAYPDVFTAGAIIAGIPVGCATDTVTAFSCMNTPPTRTPAQWASAVRAKAPSGTTDWPEVSIWHGDADFTVRPGNATGSRDQWTAVHGVAQTPTATSSLPGGTTRAVYASSDGAARVTTYTIAGMGHATPNDPGTGAQQCGQAGAYFADTLCSSWYDAVAWGLDGGSGGTPPTTTTPTTPPTSTPPTTGPSLGCWTASNYAHTQAGRATQSGGRAYAVGSGTDLGLWNTFVTTSLRETSAGYYTNVPAC